ncbi:MAG: pitrilysin family protein, partial [Planctomycetota bacterium]
EGLEGTAHLVGALADQGTAKLSEEEIIQTLEPHGGEMRGDAYGLAGTIVGSQWKVLAKTMTEVAQRPSYPTREVQRQKGRLLDRLRVQAEDPRVQGAREFRRLIYGAHWLGRSSHGTPESVERIQARDLRSFHKKNWVAKRATISVCGDVDPAEVKRVFQRALSSWKSGKAYEPKKLELPPIASRHGAFRANRQQVHVYLGHLGIRRADPDYPALVVMDHVLGTGPGFTNRISRKLRDEQGLAYTVHAAIHSSAGLSPGTFTAYIGTSPDKVGTAVEGFLTEMRRIRDEPVADQELNVAKSYLLGSHALGFERASRRASYMISAELHGFAPDHLERTPELYAAVTAEDVQRAAQKHLHPDKCCLAAAGPISKKALAGLLP